MRSIAGGVGEQCSPTKRLEINDFDSDAALCAFGFPDDHVFCGHGKECVDVGKDGVWGGGDAWVDFEGEAGGGYPSLSDVFDAGDAPEDSSQ